MSAPMKPVSANLTTATKKKIAFSSPSAKKSGQIITLYGEAGTGKTTAALCLDGKSAVIDLENSTTVLLPKLKTLGADNFVLAPEVADFDGLCEILNADLSEFDNVIIDSFSVVMEMLKAYTFTHEPYFDGKTKRTCTCIEDYSFKSFPSYAFKCFPRLWNALETLKKQGKIVVCICHDAYETVPVGDGSEFKSFFPDAFSVKSGRDSIRHHIVNNSDQVLFLKSNVVAGEKKVAIGNGEVNIYSFPLPYICAKSRTNEHTDIVTYTRGEKFPWHLFISK